MLTQIRKFCTLSVAVLFTCTMVGDSLKYEALRVSGKNSRSNNHRDATRELMLEKAEILRHMRLFEGVHVDK